MERRTKGGSLTAMHIANGDMETLGQVEQFSVEDSNSAFLKSSC